MKWNFLSVRLAPAHRKLMNVFVTVDRLGCIEEVHTLAVGH